MKRLLVSAGTGMIAAATMLVVIFTFHPNVYWAAGIGLAIGTIYGVAGREVTR